MKPKSKYDKPKKVSAAPVRGLSQALEVLRKQNPDRILFVPPVPRTIPMRHAALGQLLAGSITPGFPCGKYIEVLGEAHSGKTTLAFAFADAIINQPEGSRHPIRLDSGEVVEIDAPRRVLYLDFEHAVDLRYLQGAARNVVLAESDSKGNVRNAKTANLWLHQPDTLEEGAEIAVQLIGSGEFGMVVIDSIPAMLPQEEKDKAMGEKTMGTHAAAMGKFFRRTTGLTARYNVSVVMINQWRDKIGVVFGDPRRSPGGKAMNYYDSIKLDVSGPKGSPWFPEGGKIANIKAMKNKVTGRLGVCSYHVGAGWGISPEVELTIGLEAAGIIKTPGPGRPVTIFPGKAHARTYKTRDEWLRFLRNGTQTQWDKLATLAKSAGPIDKPSRSAGAFMAEGDDE